MRPKTATISPRSVVTRRSLQPLRPISARQVTRFAHWGAVARKTRSSATASQLAGYGLVSGVSEELGMASSVPPQPVPWAMIPACGAGSQGWRSCKPSSVRPLPGKRPDGHLSGMAVTRHLVRPTRGSNGPGQTSPPIWPCSDWGLPCRGLLPAARWALTPPFHPYPPCGGRSVLCGPVRRLAAPRRYLAVCPVELGLSSARLPAGRDRPAPPPPAQSIYAREGSGVTGPRRSRAPAPASTL